MSFYLISLCVLSFLLISYSLFLIRRNGTHLLTIGFLQGFGFSLIYSSILLIYFKKDIHERRVEDVLSFRGICWLFLCAFLLVLGKELAVFFFKAQLVH